MTLKFCPRCRADVEDAGGFCLLGHRFPEAASDPIADLRAQVEKAFERVHLDVATVMKSARPAPPAALPEEAAPDAAPAAPVYAQLEPNDDDLLQEVTGAHRDYWSQLRVDEEKVDGDDPILAFSPSPRMEWGPSNGRRRRKDRA